MVDYKTRKQAIFDEWGYCLESLRLLIGDHWQGPTKDWLEWDRQAQRNTKVDLIIDLFNSGKDIINNEIYTDKKNKIVYKFGSWETIVIDRYPDAEEPPWSLNPGGKSIKNEFIAYSLLNNTSNTNEKKHFPKLYDCILIPETKYAVLVIEYKDDLKQYEYYDNIHDFPPMIKKPGSMIDNNLNQNEKERLHNETKSFLRSKGIVNDDLANNNYYYVENNKNIFYCIDFEEISVQN